MIVKTDEYMRSHGKTPRGTGAWMFSIGKGIRLPDGQRDYNHTVTFYGTYTIARAEALKEARKHGETSITVLP